MKIHPDKIMISRYLTASFIAIVLILLYITHIYNYLLFHSISELFSIIIAYTLFVIAWNSSKYIQNPYLLFIGIAYFFIAGLDVLHTFSFEGMNIFKKDQYYANQLWIAARFMESLTLLAGFLFFKFKTVLNRTVIFSVYLGISVILVSSIFIWDIFPECFIAGSGQTPFKIYSEYLICALLILSALLLFFRYRDRFTPMIFRLLFFSILCTVVSELAFTFYISNYGLSNLVGHYFKIFSYYLLYKAIIETGINEPYALIFNELKTQKDNLEIQVAEEVRKNMELEKFIHFQSRRAAMGEMIGNIAHQWNQPLTSLSVMIQNSSIQLRNGSPDCARLLDKNKKMLDIISFMSQTMADFRNFFKPDKEKTHFSLREICSRVSSIMEGSLIDNGISIEITGSENVTAYGFENEYAQVVLNLIANAKDALVQNKAGKPLITLHIETDNGLSVLSVSDNAGGIPPGILEKIFITYYTSKPNGTGMGLFMSRRIIEGMGGNISAENTAGGACFKVTL